MQYLPGKEQLERLIARAREGTTRESAGRHALVTGGARGIGLAIASLLASEGARVSIVSRSPRGAAKVTRVFFRAEATSPTKSRCALRLRHAGRPTARSRFSSITPGIAESAPLARTGLAMWDRIIATNLTGTFLCTREASTI